MIEDFKAICTYNPPDTLHIEVGGTGNLLITACDASSIQITQANAANLYAWLGRYLESKATTKRQERATTPELDKAIQAGHAAAQPGQFVPVEDYDRTFSQALIADILEGLFDATYLDWWGKDYAEGYTDCLDEIRRRAGIGGE